MRITPEAIKALVEKVKRINTKGMVCDDVGACEGWMQSYQQIKDGLDYFDYQTEGKGYRGDRFNRCPWCSKKLEWDKWGRLK